MKPRVRSAREENKDEKERESLGSNRTFVRRLASLRGTANLVVDGELGVRDTSHARGETNGSSGGAASGYRQIRFQ